MTVISLTTFIDIFDGKTNSLQHSFQNSEPSATGITANLNIFGSREYKFLSFIYQGAELTRTGDNIEAALILANQDDERNGSTSFNEGSFGGTNYVGGANKLSMSFAREAIEKKFSIHVYTCKMNEAFTSVEKILTTDTWLVASMSYDPATIQVLLSSGVDSVGGNIGRYLTTGMVGHLPVTGQIFSR